MKGGAIPVAEQFRMNGSAALSIYTQESAARPLERPRKLPDAPAQTQPKEKLRLVVSPFTIVGGVAAILMLLLVVFSFVRMFEEQGKVSALQDTRAALTQEQERLTATYEQSLDLKQIEQRARQLGMREVRPSQIREIEIAAGDTTRVFDAPEERNIFEQVFDAFQSLFRDMVEYFS